MSVEVGYFIVDWNDFQQALKDVGSAFDVFEEREMEPEPMSTDSMSAQMDFLDVYEEFKDSWQSSSKPFFEQFFDALFWSWRDKKGRKIIDLEAEVEMVDSAWSPETVKRFGEIWSKVELESARSAFEAQSGQEWTFEGFRSFAEEHGALVQRATEAGKGLIVFIYG